MKSTINIQCVRRAALALALAIALPAQAAGDAAALRVVSTHSEVHDGATSVQARVTRTRAARVLTPQRLRIAIVAADGSVRAEQQREIGPAQLSRRGTRDLFLTAQLNAVASGDERVVVEWVKPAL